MEQAKVKQAEIGEIPKKLKKFRLGELVDITSSKRIFFSEYLSDGIPFYRSKEIIEKFNNQNVSTELFISRERFKKIKREYGVPQSGDILLTSVGTLGVPWLIEDDSEFYFKDGNLTWFRNFKKETLWNKYLYYWLISRQGKQKLLESSIGSTQQALTIAGLKNIEIELPSLGEQRAIAKILFDLDEKIELNHQMNKTIESIAQAIFKQWFVDFEFPDEKGRPYKSSGGKMVESELREIPPGWQVRSLGESGTFKNGINYLRDEIGDTDFFIANVRDIANNKLLLKGSLDKIKINLSKAKEYLLQEKDILIARSASPGEISLVLGDLEKVIYSGFSIRYRLNNPNNYLYIFHIMQGLKRNLQNYSIGTTLQSVNQETLKNMKFILPSDETLKEFNRISKQILDKALNNLLQNRELSQIRDSLLPRLMSGKIRV